RGTSHQADIDFRHAEHRVVGRQNDVAGGGQSEPRAKRRTIHGGDHRFGTFADRVEHFAHQAIESPVLAGGVSGGTGLHVGAGREHLAEPGQDGDAHGVPVGKRIERGDQLLTQLIALRVHRRPVHHDGGDVIPHGDLDDGLHGVSSNWNGSRLCHRLGARSRMRGSRMWTTRIVLLLLGAVTSGAAHAQAPLAVGTPQAAFDGGPIHLSPRAAAMLRAQYKGDNVPQVPQPFRGQLDTALVGMDWKRAEAVKKALVEKDGPVPALLWEQTGFVPPGSIGVAETHARDVAATGSSGLFETAAMMLFYAVGVTMTDGEKCVDAAARDAHLDRLRSPEFEPVLQIVRTIADDRLGAERGA